MCWASSDDEDCSRAIGLCRKLERERNMLLTAGYVLQEAVVKLIDSDENIKSATDDELEEAMENGYAPEIRTQAASVLLARNAVRMTGYLFPENVQCDATAEVERCWREVARMRSGWHPWLVMPSLLAGKTLAVGIPKR